MYKLLSKKPSGFRLWQKFILLTIVLGCAIFFVLNEQKDEVTSTDSVFISTNSGSKVVLVDLVEQNSSQSKSIHPSPDIEPEESQKQLTVAGNSMSPTLNAGDVVNLNRTTKKHFRRNELVAIQFLNRSDPMLKRIYALPGDQVRIDNGILFLNGTHKQPTAWNDAHRISEKKAFVLLKQLERSNFIVPRNRYIVFGDNPVNSLDSLDYGFIDQKQLMGRIEVHQK